MNALLRLSRLLILALVGATGHVAAALDASFAQDGSVVLPWTNFTTTAQVAVVRAPDGGTYVIRYQDGSLRLTRLRADGTVDGAFGLAGTSSVDFGGPAGYAPVGNARVQADGSLLVPASGLLRITATGELDRTFAQNGKLTLPQPSSGMCANLVPQAIVAGDAGELLLYGTNWDFLTGFRMSCSVVWRLRTDMTIDPSFGSGGFYSSGFHIDDLRVTAGGIEMVGSQGPGVLQVKRLTRAGLPDASFGAGGTVSLSQGHPAAKILSDGSKLVARLGINAVIVQRFRPDNAMDTTFGISGEAVVPLPATATGQGPLFALPDGGYVIAYRSNTRIHFFKLDAQGRLDTKFGTGGHFHYRGDGHEYDRLVGWELQPDGYLVFVVQTEHDFAIGGPYIHEAVRLQLVSNLVEFHNSVLDHYFVAYDGAEAHGIDNGSAGPGWSRTQHSFRPGGTRAVCRFYGTPGVGPNSHFFTIEPAECEQVKRDPGWTYEGLGFYATPTVNGACAGDLRPVHRLYNNRWMHNDSSHRYVVSSALIAPMQAAGWIYEGVAFCARP